ncbi:zinc ABC transporter substrate-binding protein [Aliiroseovarius sp. KMU-50]|uniref:High-affinity zinc uptake system protein ZnuA n=1 Tax=Aliiroseovarius salicola TaxID=3009082 RepID=A0ABT4W3Z0_9RHOB|nr:zinc ABC transporter substrate-binding protein [Aliiroseovarius sp. KMU-50]MDA5095236.1 zinc ABC transporter substrate-binding protein [Aliiroseovarius sp. KMU-50]
MFRATLLSLACLLSSPSLAESPNVVTDIAPIHSIVAQVMEGVGTPDLILPPGASPHGYAMRPSEAAALENADLVVWVGLELTPWLEKPLRTISANTSQLALLEHKDTMRLTNRETALFAPEEHEDEHDHDAHNHSDGATDPHVWLDPENARIWLDVIAEALSNLDPANAQAYQDNAARAEAKLTRQIDEIRTQLARLKDTPYIVFHDAYQYFEARFDLAATGAISMSDATRPSPARIAELKTAIKQADIRCALTEPQFNSSLFETVFEDTKASIRVIDPLGTKLTPGTTLYGDLINDMARGLTSCAE